MDIYQNDGWVECYEEAIFLGKEVKEGVSKNITFRMVRKLGEHQRKRMFQNEED